MTPLLSTVVATLLLQAPTDASSLQLAAGAQLGAPHLVGAVGRATLVKGGRPRFDVEAAWEPSWFLQSYSLAASWRPAGSIFFAGPRLRLLQFHAPWERGFRADTDTSVGLSAEAGARLPFGPDERLTFSASAFVTWVPAQAQNLQGLFGISVGVCWTFAALRPGF